MDFVQMYLVMEVNKMQNRFGGTISIAIKKVILQETKANLQEHIYKTLSKFMSVVSAFDNWFLEASHEVQDSYENVFHDKYLNILLNSLNVLYIKCGHGSFIKKFSSYYWNASQELLLEMWGELPNQTTVADNEASFIKIFEDLFNETVKKIPDVCIKKLSEFTNLYRASTFEVYDNYKYILPDPLYCKDNRWNDDGVAYLYLSYDNENYDYKNIKMGQKTCFEEIRLKDNIETSICNFKAIRMEAKILDLSYDGVDYDEIVNSITTPSADKKNQLLDAIEKDKKLKKRLQQYAKSGRKDLFERELKIFQKRLGLDAELQEFVQKQISFMMLGNICDAIFYAVDKVEDPSLEAYIPFRKFSKYLISIGIDGVAYRSTRMQKLGLKGKCLTLFNKNDATYISGTMEVYIKNNDEYKLLKKY